MSTVLQARINFIKTDFVKIFNFIKFVPMTKKLLHKKDQFCQNFACNNQFYQVKFLENWLKVAKTKRKIWILLVSCL